MKHFFLSSSDLKLSLTLEPKEDTLYILPSVPEVRLELQLSFPGVRAFVLGLFHTESEQELHITQNHTAPHTESHILVKSLVASSGYFHYQGNIAIAKEADGSIASQEARGLTQGAGARFKAVPSLEILPKNVSCTHKASSSPVNKDSLFILQTKGFSEIESQNILENAFLQSAFEVASGWGVSPETLTSIKKSLEN